MLVGSGGRYVGRIWRIDMLAGCGFYFKVWILLQGVDSVTGCEFYYRVRILLQG